MATSEPGRHGEERQVSDSGSLGKAAGLGVLLTGLASATSWLVAGLPGLTGSATFGGVGIVIHLVAAAVLGRSLDQSFKRLAAGFVAGMVLRLAGAIGAFVAVTQAPTVFAPLPTLFGYLVVIVPLLFTEMRFLK